MTVKKISLAVQHVTLRDYEVRRDEQKKMSLRTEKFFDNED